MFRTARMICIVSVLSVGILRAQTPDTATVTGHITDQRNAAIPGVTVTATNSITGFARRTQTDSSGGFSLAGMPVAGRYRLTAQKEGFAERTLSDVALAAGTTAELSLQLTVSGGQTKVTVTGEIGRVRA